MNILSSLLGADVDPVDDTRLNNSYLGTENFLLKLCRLITVGYFVHRVSQDRLFPLLAFGDVLYLHDPKQ